MKEVIEFFPEKTAVHKNKPSPVARWIATSLIGNERFERILDYGCGYGDDVLYYRGLGMDAEGYDPYNKFGWSTEPRGLYNLITINYV